MVILQQTMDVAKSFGHVFLVSAIGGIASVAFGAWFSLTLVSGRYTRNFVLNAHLEGSRFISPPEDNFHRNLYSNKG